MSKSCLTNWCFLEFDKNQKGCPSPYEDFDLGLEGVRKDFIEIFSEKNISHRINISFDGNKNSLIWPKSKIQVPNFDDHKDNDSYCIKDLSISFCNGNEKFLCMKDLNSIDWILVLGLIFCLIVIFLLLVVIVFIIILKKIKRKNISLNSQSNNVISNGFKKINSQNDDHIYQNFNPNQQEENKKNFYKQKDQISCSHGSDSVFDSPRSLNNLVSLNLNWNSENSDYEKNIEGKEKEKNYAEVIPKEDTNDFSNINDNLNYIELKLE